MSTAGHCTSGLRLAIRLAFGLCIYTSTAFADGNGNGNGNGNGAGVTPAPASLGYSDAATKKLELFSGIGYLGSRNESGAAVTLGVRYRPISHFALSFDVGYGTMLVPATNNSGANSVEDRWWILPSAALVISEGPIQFDFGAGVGLGTATGFANLTSYSHDQTTFAYQLVPALRTHVIAAVALKPNLSLYARADIAFLVIDGNSLGFRSESGPAGTSDTVWVNVSIGVRFGLL